MAQHKRALTEVVQDQGGQHKDEPVQANWPSSKMAHVGVERLGARHGEEYRSKGQEADPTMAGQKAQGKSRVQCREHDGVLYHLRQPRHGQHYEP
jgi:hypothetical protein